MFVDISICESAYDTKLYVYENDAGNNIACNDDACSNSSGEPFRSSLEQVSLTAGNTYYIVVDGYSGASGEYNISVTEAETPPDAPDNDECANAEAVTGPYPVEITSSSAGATIDCEGFLNWEAVWYELELPYASNNVDVFVQADGAISNGGIILTSDCSCDPASSFIYSSGFTFDAPGGNINVWFDGVSGADNEGTILFPLFIDAPQGYTVTFDVTEFYVPAYSVYRDGGETPVATGVVGTTYTDEWVAGGVEYCYTVTQTMPDGTESGHSNQACATPDSAVLYPPSDLTAEAVDGGVSLNWSEGAAEGIYSQCFEICEESPWDLTVDHYVDGGVGGWFRSSTGTDVPCGTGFNTCGSDVNAGNSAIAVWTISEHTESRMVTPPVDLTGNSSASLNYLGAYTWSSDANTDNLIEVSTDGGSTWTTVFTDSPFIIGDNTYEQNVDLSAYAGEIINVAFTYRDNAYGEGWYVDDIEILVGARANTTDNTYVWPRTVGDGSAIAKDNNVYVVPGSGAEDSYNRESINSREFLTYNVYRAEDAGEFALLGSVADSTHYLDGTVEYAEYSYYVTAAYSNGESDPTDTASVDLTNYPPTAFTLYSPADGDTIVIDQSNLGSDQAFAWGASTDPNGTAVEYNVCVTVAVPFDQFCEDNGTSTAQFVPLADIADYIDSLNQAAGTGVVLSLNWTVFASDGVNETEASNGPLSVTFDAGWVLGVDEEMGIPDVFALQQNYPNPFNPVTTIRFDVPQESHIRMDIYNLLGQRVRTLVNSDMRAGYHAISWNGTNDMGKPLSSGMYIYSLHSSEFTSVKKLVLMK
jgi:hypothetical protein